MTLAETRDTDPQIRKPLPFDAEQLDKLLDDAGIDVLVATSKHNIQYLLGGYRFFFFDSMDAVGVSRYLPALIYRKGKPEQATYVGCGMESYEQENGKFWPANLDLGADRQQGDHAARAGAHQKARRRASGRCGIRPSCRPTVRPCCARACRTATSSTRCFRWSGFGRARRRRRSAICASSSERVVASMMATFAQCKPGMTKHEVNETLRREEVNRGLVFDYCLLTAGTSLNRAPSEQRLATGDIMSLDSGGNYKGYIGDLCRMGILGATPDAELVDLLGFIEEVQQAARRPIKRGARGGDVIDVAQRILDASPHRKSTHYMAHGMGLVTHEAPRLMNNPRMSYTGYDMDRPLESGMVISIETTMSHPKRGFIKLEDTVLVTDNGYEALGDSGRGWNKAGS